jgi:hypothetical protein
MYTANRGQTGKGDFHFLVMALSLRTEIDDSLDVAADDAENNQGCNQNNDHGGSATNNHITSLFFLFQLLTACLAVYFANFSTHSLSSSKKIITNIKDGGRMATVTAVTVTGVVRPPSSSL